MAKPFIKWAGGKRGLLDSIAPLVPASPSGYSECFIGGGAVFWGLMSLVRPARLSDVNERLIAAYKGVQSQPEEVIRVLHELNNDRETYELVRGLFNTDRKAPVHLRAAWFIYLNRTCTNGLYRENADGEFNASYGDGKGTVCHAETIMDCSRALVGVQLDVMDFEESLARVRPGEFVYLDPPYIPLPDDDNFTTYSKGGFSFPVPGKHQQLGLFEKPKKTDHERVADCLLELDARKARFVLSNSDTPLARQLYAGFEIVSIDVRRSIGLGADRRESAPEILVHNMRAAK